MSNERRFGGTLFGLGEADRQRLAREAPEEKPAAPQSLGETVRLGSDDGGQIRAQLEAAIRARTESTTQVRMPSTRAPTLIGTEPLQEAEFHVPTRKGQGQPPLPEAATRSLVPTLKGRGQPPLPETAGQSLVPTLKGRGQPPLPEAAAQSLVPTLKGQGDPPAAAEAASPRPTPTLMMSQMPRTEASTPGLEAASPQLSVTMVGMLQTPSPEVAANPGAGNPPAASLTHIKTLMSPVGPAPEPASEQPDLIRPPSAERSAALDEPGQPDRVAQPQPATTPTFPVQPATYSSSPPPAVLSQAPAEPAHPRRRGSAGLLVPLLGLLFVFGLVGVGAMGYGYYRYSTTVAEQPGAVQDEGAEGTAERDRAEGEKPHARGSRPGALFPSDQESEANRTAAPSASAAAPAGAAGSDEPAVRLKCTPGCDQMKVIVCDGKIRTLVNGGLDLEPGTHACMFQAPGYAVSQYGFEVKQGEQLEVSVILTPRRTTAEPPPAEAESENCGTFINRCKK